MPVHSSFSPRSYPLRRAWPALLLLFVGLGTGCQSAPKLAGFDEAAFRADRRGCTGARARQQTALELHHAELVGLTERQVSAFFGHPDKTDLGERGNRTYVYWLTPGPACGGGTTAPRQLRLHINALDKVSEALLVSSPETEASPEK